MRKKLILVLIAAVLALLAVPAPAFAIHDPNVPAGVCANSVNAVGIPSITAGDVSDHRDLSFSNSVLNALDIDHIAEC
jgi:hypothetical protein